MSTCLLTLSCPKCMTYSTKNRYEDLILTMREVSGGHKIGLYGGLTLTEGLTGTTQAQQCGVFSFSLHSKIRACDFQILDSWGFYIQYCITWTFYSLCSRIFADQVDPEFLTKDSSKSTGQKKSETMTEAKSKSRRKREAKQRRRKQRQEVELNDISI